MTVKIVPTKAIKKCICFKTASSTLLKVIFILNMLRLIRGNKKVNIKHTQAELLISRTLFRYKSCHDSLWQCKLTRNKLENSSTQQHPIFKSLSSFRSKLWVASTGWPKLHKSLSFCYQLQPWYQVREEMRAEFAHQCQITDLHSPKRLKIKGKSCIDRQQEKKIHSVLVLLRFFKLSTVNTGMQKFVFPTLIMEFSRIYCLL